MASKNKQIVHIKMPNGSIAPFDVMNNATIQNVKQAIYEYNGIDIEQQDLYYNGICLDNQCHVLSFNDCTLHLQQKGMIISVLHWECDQLIQLNICSNASIQELKRKIYEKEGIPVEHQIITFHQSSDLVHLDDDVILSQCDINSNSPFMLFINAPNLLPRDQNKTKRYGLHKKKRKHRNNYRRNNKKRKNKYKSNTKQQKKRKNSAQHNKQKNKNCITFSDQDGEHANDGKYKLNTLDSSNPSDHCVIDSEWEQESNLLYDKAEKQHNRLLDLYQFDLLTRERIYIKNVLYGIHLNSKDDEIMNMWMLIQIKYEIESLKELSEIYKEYRQIITVNNTERNQLKHQIKIQIKKLKEREDNFLESQSTNYPFLQTECNANIKRITNDHCSIYNEYIENLEQIFLYNCDFPGNGIVDAIATSFGEEEFNIPCDKIDIHLSSKHNESNQEYEILRSSPFSCLTKPEPNPWIIIDFTPKMIKPTHYSLTHYGTSVEPLRYWVFEGSNDNRKTWKLLSKHENDESLCSKQYVRATWTLSDYHEYHSSNVLNEFYTHFRILQTNLDPNNNELSSMICNEFEIYGIVKDMDPIKMSNDLKNNFDDLFIDRMRQKYRNLVKDHRNNKEELMLKTFDCEKLQKQFDKLSKQYDELQTLNRREIEIKTNMIRSITTEKTQIEEKYNDLDTKYNNLQSHYQCVEKSKDEINDKYHESEKAKQRLTSNIAVLYNKYNESEKSNRKMMEKHNKLKQKYNTQKTQIQTLQQQTKQFESDHIELQQQFNNMKHKNESIKCKMDRIENEYQELQKKYNEHRNRFGYIEWTAKEIANWIININPSQYSKYYKDLLNNLSTDCIDGECLADLDKNDLRGFGIIVFKDRCDILRAIQDLIGNRNNNKNNEWKIEYDKLKTVYDEELKRKECVVCFDGDRMYCCLPCGHKCLCAKCKDIINGKCPMCQNSYNSLTKIYDL